MRRTIETAQLSLSWLINKGVKLEADARWQENSAKPCDTGSPVEALEKEFPTVDFSNVDPVYPDKTSPAGAKYAYNRKAILARGRSALASLYQRPEQVVFVVSHSGFLRAGLTGHWWFNADYRIFDLEQIAATGDTAGLKQWESTLAGGLGWSRTTTVPLGDALPEEDAVDPPDV